MNWDNLSLILKQYYQDKGLSEWFTNDEKYLSESFIEIDKLWLKNYNSIDTINYVMISEAPLWGIEKKYIYNPKINNSQYFYRSDLEYVLNKTIHNKGDFLEELIAIGFIIIDISPFALNAKSTVINYRTISKTDYKRLLIETFPIYFSERLELIKTKTSNSVKYFHRYSRVRKAFNELISKIIFKNKLVRSQNEIFDISQDGGGINKIVLNEIING